MIKPLGQNKYRFIVSIGGRNNRKRYTKTITHKGGKRALQILYDEFERECKQTPLSDVSVKELINAHIDHCEALNRKATTMRGYRVCAERIYPLVDGLLAKDCATYHIDKMIAQMSNNGLSAKTIKNTIGFLSTAFEYGVYIDLVESNPCKKASLPQGDSREIRILYLDEIPKFLEAIADIDLNDKVAYELALFLGLRRSEMLGLKESDVDIVKGVVYVHTTRHRVGGEDIEQDTKTKRSTRILALPDILLIDIARLLQVHRDFPYEKVDYLIQDGFGNAINPQTLATRLERLEKEKGLPHVTLHGLRHTYASLLHSQGVDMAMISAELGHSNLTTTMNIYTHMLQSASNASRGIANTINNFNSRGISVAQEDNEKALEH